MKPTLLLLVVFSFFAACNNAPKQDDVKTDSSASKEVLSYPFTPRYSINWKPGDEQNAQQVLNCLKKYVDGDIKGCAAYFADSAEFVGDKFHFKGSRDSLEKVLSAMRNATPSLSKEFDSWMTLYYPDKDATWVTLWYTEKWTDTKGKLDSIYYTDDVLVRNGKILLYDEKQRQFPEPPKMK